MMDDRSALVAPSPRPPPREQSLQGAITSQDVRALARRYQEDDGHLVLPGFLGGPLLDEAIAEVRRLMPSAHRSYVPFMRRGSAISHPAIASSAPTLHAIQGSPALLDFFQQITGPTLEHRRADDPHASALYVYTRARDHVSWHYDDCGCVPEASFTVLLGLVNRTTSQLQIELFRRPGSGRRVIRSVSTEPGTLVFLCGTKAYHRVTPLREGEERVAFSFVYVKDGHHPEGLARLRQNAIDSLLYFGIGSRRERR